MGTWGIGPFQSDDAIEFVEWLLSEIRCHIETDLSTLDDGVLERPFPAAIAILRSLASDFPVIARRIRVDEVDRWAEVYLKWLRENSSEWFDPQHFESHFSTVEKELTELKRHVVAAN